MVELCTKCHTAITPGARFCLSCGLPVLPPQAEGAPVDPLVGQTFKGTYLIQQRIGGGGMGEVYKATHVTLDMPVALKILKKTLLADSAIVGRFHQEARAASRLRHRNVIAVTDFGQTDDGTLYMAMEYIDGKSLGRLIAEEKPLAERRIVHICGQILSALEEAHASRILHRDLKPENVMVESRRSELDLVKVLDFGIAKLQAPEEQRAALTKTGIVCGTPGYMSPEQWSGEPLDARSDLYSVGVILYEMLTGRLPFEAKTPVEMARAQLSGPPVRPSVRRGGEGVSPDLEALVMRALSHDREERPARADLMRGDLLSCALLTDTARDSRGPDAKTTIVRKARPAEPVPESGGSVPVEVGNGSARTAVRKGGSIPPSGSEGGGGVPVAASSPVPAPTVHPGSPGPESRGDAKETPLRNEPERHRPRARSRALVGLLAGGVVIAATSVVYFLVRPGATRPAAARDTGSTVEIARPATPPAEVEKAAAAPVPGPGAGPPAAETTPGRVFPVAANDRESGAPGPSREAPTVRTASRVQAGATQGRRGESVCSRLLERETLGEPLSDRERRTLDQECRK